MAAGELRERVAFSFQASSDSSFGTVAGDWTDDFTRSARIQFLKGGEPVLAQRLTGVQPVVITVRFDSETRTVDTSWRIRDTRSGTLYNIRAVTPGEKRDMIDFLCDAGVAQ